MITLTTMPATQVDPTLPLEASPRRVCDSRLHQVGCRPFDRSRCTTPPAREPAPVAAVVALDGVRLHVAMDRWFACTEGPDEPYR